MKWVRALVSLVPAVLVAACSGNQSALNAHGAAAIELQRLILFFFAICTIVWLLVMAALVASLVRRREHSEVTVGEPRMTAWVASSLAVTALILVGLTVLSFVATRAMPEAAEGNLAIRIQAKQWWWQVTYLNADQSRDFDTANEIHIPVGRTVRLELESPDVIHSFWMPSLAGKQDLIPGRTNTLAIRAERAGVYRGQCAEFCGLQHAHMAVFVVAEDEASFESWMVAQRSGRVPSFAAEAAAGEALFQAKPCAACHTIRGTKAEGTTGPDLTHVASRGTIAAGLLETTSGSFAAWIADPQTLKPGNNMPMVTLSGTELRQITAYMESLR